MKKLISLFLVLGLCLNVYAGRMVQQNVIPAATALTVSGGATPAVTGPGMRVGGSVSSFSLILVNGDDSTSLTVTYEIGYKNSSKVLTYLTPADGGAITALTAVDCNSDDVHASVSLAPADYYRFTVTNGDAVNTAEASLIIMYQE